MIGGIGYATGALIAGTFAFGGLGARVTESLGFAATALDLLSGALLVVILFANPNGIADSNVRTLRPGPAPAAPSRPAEPLPTGEIELEGGTLEVRDLTVRFGGVVALDDVTLDVRPGEVLGLIGPNGAGKTTFIDAVAGFVDVAPGGAVALDGEPIDRWSPTRRARAGLGRSFQSLELFEDVTVRENLLVACDDHDPARYGLDLVHPGRPVLSPVAAAAVREFGLER